MIQAGRPAARASHVVRDLRTLWALVRPRRHAASHAARLEAFYAPQAADYDRFRDRLLTGRRDLIAALPVADGAVWVDLGGGTGRNLGFIGSDIHRLARVHLVDLSASLLAVARARVAAAGWNNVVLHAADATSPPLPSGCADVVIFSYSLTMMPEWFAAIDRAAALLKPGGLVGVVDFYVSRRHAAPFAQHGPWTRTWTPWWFARSGVRLNPDHLPYLFHRFEPVSLVESASPLPFLPGVRVPTYRFVGRRNTADVSS